ncbi:LysR family transcriptional regulator [Leisingera aquimarina]|uniref:LysR family transcriptional regulator n=1 Tax=Leisingera aquimarina TaxID=476529 RepID=UPI001FE231B9|nr:LysR family transcriptional regulator [Leisingera aquimarina]
MQINAFETFLAIEAAGSFHGAARRLHITQTAVSARIKALEEGLGASLFERGPGGTRLSAAGRQFLPYAEQMMRTWEFVSGDLRESLAGRVSLRLGAQLSVWDPLLVDVAVWLEQAQGTVPFTLNYDHGLNMAEAVARRLLDLAIVNEVPAGTRLGVEELPPEELVLVSDQRLRLGRDALPLFINLEFGSEYAAQVQQVLPQRSRQHIVLGNAPMGLRYLMKRGGMGYFPAYMAAGALAAGQIHRVEGARDIQLSCKVLYLPDNPALEQIRQVLQGLREMRDQNSGAEFSPENTCFPG